MSDAFRVFYEVVFKWVHFEKKSFVYVAVFLIGQNVLFSKKCHKIPNFDNVLRTNHIRQGQEKECPGKSFFFKQKANIIELSS